MPIGNWHLLDFFDGADTGWVKAAVWRKQCRHADEVLFLKKKNEKVFST
jgi:hypothetical protein